jgi:hypothetical protein
MLNTLRSALATKALPSSIANTCVSLAPPLGGMRCECSPDRARLKRAARSGVNLIVPGIQSACKRTYAEALPIRRFSMRVGVIKLDSMGKASCCQSLETIQAVCSIVFGRCAHEFDVLPFVAHHLSIAVLRARCPARCSTPAAPSPDLPCLEMPCLVIPNFQNCVGNCAEIHRKLVRTEVSVFKDRTLAG